jgi:endoglucanase
MDAIGMMVSRIEDGFLHITEVGSIDPRVLPGTPVIVHASGSREDLPGVIAIPSAHLLPDGERKDTVAIKYMLVDTGLTAREVSKRVRVGDLISFNTEPVELSGETVSGHSLDNRSSIVALTICLEELQSRSHLWDVWVVASTQEEVSSAGAQTSAFQLRPSLAVVVDMSYGKGPGTDGWNTFAIGAGPTLAIGPNAHPFLRRRFQDVARKAGVPTTGEPMPIESLTNADAMQLSAEGLPTMVIGIPLRNMHTPVEIVSMKDIRCTGRLLAEFIASLESDFLEKMNVMRDA